MVDERRDNAPSHVSRILYMALALCIAGLLRERHHDTEMGQCHNNVTCSAVLEGRNKTTVSTTARSTKQYQQQPVESSPWTHELRLIRVLHCPIIQRRLATLPVSPSTGFSVDLAFVDGNQQPDGLLSLHCIVVYSRAL